MMSATLQSGPASDLKRRVLAAVQSEPAPTRSAVRRHTWVTFVVCTALALVIFAQAGGIHTAARPLSLMMWTYVGWILAASAAAALGIARGRSMLPRSSASLATLIIALPLAIVAWKIAVTVPFGPEMMAPWAERPGFRCLGLSLLMAAPLLVAFIVMRRRTDPVHPGIAGAVLGVTAGLAAGSLVDLWCPVGHVPHVLLGHILPLGVLAFAGACAGRRLLAP